MNSTNYESEPLDLHKKAFLLRQREPEKELGASYMKFKPNSTVERVLDRVNQSTVNSIHDVSKYHSALNSPRKLDHSKVSPK